MTKSNEQPIPGTDWHTEWIRKAGELEIVKSKLHLLQQEFQEERQQRVHLEKENDLITVRHNELKQEYDKLKSEKGDWLDIAGTASRKYNELWVEHHDLKAKAEKMQRALEEIAYNDPSSSAVKLIRIANDGLSSYNSNTNNQNENNG